MADRKFATRSSGARGLAAALLWLVCALLAAFVALLATRGGAALHGGSSRIVLARHAPHLTAAASGHHDGPPAAEARADAPTCVARGEPPQAKTQPIVRVVFTAWTFGPSAVGSLRLLTDRSGRGARALEVARAHGRSLTEHGAQPRAPPAG